MAQRTRSHFKSSCSGFPQAYRELSRQRPQKKAPAVHPHGGCFFVMFLMQSAIAWGRPDGFCKRHRRRGRSAGPEGERGVSTPPSLPLDTPLPWTGCGSQRMLRPLSGPCILLATAPTTPPCFRHWRRSSLLHHKTTGCIRTQCFRSALLLQQTPLPCSAFPAPCGSRSSAQCAAFRSFPPPAALPDTAA